MIPCIDPQNFFEYFPKSPNRNRRLSCRINLARDNRNEVSCNVPYIFTFHPLLFSLPSPIHPSPPLPVKLPSRADSLWLLGGRTLPWKAVSNFHTRTADRRWIYSLPAIDFLSFHRHPFSTPPVHDAAAAAATAASPSTSSVGTTGGIVS